MGKSFNPYGEGYLLKYPNGDISLERPRLNYSQFSKIHTVKEGETIQNIAFQYYGDSGYWDYICDIKNIFNTYNLNNKQKKSKTRRE